MSTQTYAETMRQVEYATFCLREIHARPYLWSKHTERVWSRYLGLLSAKARSQSPF